MAGGVWKKNLPNGTCVLERFPKLCAYKIPFPYIFHHVPLFQSHLWRKKNVTNNGKHIIGLLNLPCLNHHKMDKLPCSHKKLHRTCWNFWRHAWGAKRPHHNHWQVNAEHALAYLMEQQNVACNGASPLPGEVCIVL